jgi:peptidoglycan hydrolase CwlO-like protein
MVTTTVTVLWMLNGVFATWASMYVLQMRKELNELKKSNENLIQQVQELEKSVEKISKLNGGRDTSIEKFKNL